MSQYNNSKIIEIYVKLYKKLVEEYSKIEPTSIEETFYDEVSSIISRKPSSTELVKINENIANMLKNLLELRLAKQMLLRKGKLLPAESTLLRHMEEGLKIESTTQKVEVSVQPSTKEPFIRELVLFLKPVPRMIGVDGKTYGPFKVGDIANLPRENVEALLIRGAARRLGDQSESS